MILCIVGKLPREVRINSFKLYYIEVRKTRRGFKILYHYYYIIITSRKKIRKIETLTKPISFRSGVVFRPTITTI